jgi:phosphate/sulfate permease
METFFLILVIILFLLAISDLVVGVSNDAVNFLNSAVGAKAASFKLIMVVAALGILVGATFSSGMMEVARKGIFHPEFFYFSEIIILFLAVMITDVILLDAFNTYGMPTSTTVSIVFELLGAAVAISMIKIFTDPDALHLGEYINSAKALAIISGILLSVVIAFSVGVIVQYFSRLLFSFDYEKRMKNFGALWGGLAITAITYFMLIKGAKGTSFMTDEVKDAITANSFYILVFSFIGWSLLLQLLSWLTKFNILKFIVLIGTFALAMAFAGNDLVNFIGVPLAGFNSWELWKAGGATGADQFLMEGLAGKVPTPTVLLLIAGIIMVITLWTSKKAKSVVKTSLDLGRQDEVQERFSSYLLSRSLVRSFGNMANYVNDRLPKSWREAVNRQFDERAFIEKQKQFGSDAPSFDMIRASVTLVVASILIAIGTSLKLPLSTTYVTFMVFMGTSLADGAWGRESAVYRVSGVLSVIGGWFFTALSAFAVAFVVALLFHYGGMVAIISIILIAAVLIYRTHKLHDKRLEEQLAYEKKVIDESTYTKAGLIKLSATHLKDILTKYGSAMDDSLDGLAREDLNKLSKTFRSFRSVYLSTAQLKRKANTAMDKVSEDDIETGHMYIIVVDYLREMGNVINQFVQDILNHVDNNHKPLLPEQIEELNIIIGKLKRRMAGIVDVFESGNEEESLKLLAELDAYVKDVRSARKKQIRRIKNSEVGTRNSVLYLGLLGELRNLVMFSNRIVKVFHDLILNPSEEEG